MPDWESLPNVLIVRTIQNDAWMEYIKVCAAVRSAKPSRLLDTVRIATPDERRVASRLIST